MNTATEAFLPASALCCTEAERNALIATLSLFESGKMVQVKNVDDLPGDAFPEFGFDMASWEEHGSEGQKHCGTVGCIGGWAEVLGKKDGVDFSFDTEGRAVHANPASPLCQLFYVWGDNAEHFPYALRKITLQEATTALRNFLTTGHPSWKKVLNV